MPGEDAFQHGQEVPADEIEIAGVRQVGARGFEVLQRRLHGVVLGRFAGVQEAVGQHATIDAVRKGEQNLTCLGLPSRRQREPR